MGGAGKNLIWQHKNAAEWLGLQLHSCRISLLEYFPPHVHVMCFNYHQVYIQGALPSEAYNLAQSIERNHPFLTFPKPQNHSYYHKHFMSCIVNISWLINPWHATCESERVVLCRSNFFLLSLPSSKPPDGNDRLDRPNGCQDNGYRRVTENPWQCKHTAAIQTTTAFGPEPPLTGIICCVNLQLGPVWLLSGFRALGQKRRTPCPLTKGLALIGVDKGCWWSLFEQLNLVNES